MGSSRWNLRRRTAIAAALGGAFYLLGAWPVHGQGGAPTAALRQLARVPRRPWHAVTIDYHLPPGFTLVGPAVRVTDKGDKLVEYLPGFIIPGPTGPTGYRELHSQNYPPGDYQVRGEVVYLDPAGKRLSISSPPMALTIIEPIP